MRWSTSDEVVAAYFAALEARSHIPARMRSVTIEVCGRGAVPCGGQKTTRRGRIHLVADDWLGEREVAETVEICAKCGETWLPSKREVGEMTAAAGVGDNLTEDVLIGLVDRLRPLRCMVEPRPRAMLLSRWGWILATWRVYLHPCIGTYAGTAREVQATRAQVETGITQGREIIEARMGRRHIKRHTRSRARA